MDHLCNPPSFMKILHDHNAPYLALPYDFVMKHMGDKIPEKVVIRSATGYFLWNVKVKKIDGRFSFDKGWKKVLKEARLCYEDTLVFWLVGETTFKMWIYGTNGCEKVLTPKVHVKVEDVVVLGDDDGGHVDGSDGDDDGGHVDGSDGDDDGGHVDGSDSDYDGGSDGSEGGDDAGCDGSGGGGGGDVDGSDGDRYFTVTISENHKRCLGLPAHFNGLPGIRHKEDIILKNLEGEEWEMGVTFQANQYHLSRGWVVFKRDNNLEEGDECGFLFIKKEGKICLTRVTKEKKNPSPRALRVI